MMDSEERLAKRHGVRCIETTSIKNDELYRELVAIAPDLIVLGGGWHELIPHRVFSLPPLGCINTHPSLLPSFRGTSITRWQILHGVARSGSTIHYVDETFDTGGALAQASIPVDDDVTPQELFGRLSEVGADLMLSLLAAFAVRGRQPTFRPDDSGEHCEYFSRWTWDPDRLRIDWSRPLQKIHRLVTASTQESYEYSGPFFAHSGRMFILRRTGLEAASEMVLSGHSVQVVARPDGSWALSRAGDPHTLVLSQVQRFDRWYRWRRADTPLRVMGQPDATAFASQG